MNFREISKMTLPELLNNVGFKSRWTDLYNTCHGSTDGAIRFETESVFLKKIVRDNKKLLEATTLSFATALLDLAYHGLSIEPISKADAYVVPRGHNIGTYNAKKWETRALLMISGYGELKMRREAGIIRYADNPVIVYDEDTFEVVNGRVNHIARFKSQVITHAYIRIVRMDGSDEYKTFSMPEIQAYRKKADEKQQNSMAWTGGVNGQPTRGMIEAKVIKHSFSTYPRLKLGSVTVLATDELDKDAAYAVVMGEMTTNNTQVKTAPEVDHGVIEDTAKPEPATDIDAFTSSDEEERTVIGTPPAPADDNVEEVETTEESPKEEEEENWDF